ncbi:deoxyribonuclease IV [Egicoccus halophilus]|uniref:Putative endonuclease 4 n=1 Tax=Egicoccus halophilus TaxID=1670830 RepID=A0A8J3ERF1_9ACTN|nr:deoxyribonuclease IV [Egicoccus halophilus]GGI04871.1 putative endonuclease 4 [Egicoccus halophilus]
MRIGAHVPAKDPLATAAERGAEVVQLFLSAPQQFRGPKPREDADELRAGDVAIYVHAPYLVNVATTNNRVRHPSRQLLEKTVRAAEDIGALGVIVHGGHLPEEDDVAEGFANWRSTLERLETDLPILIENTAGGNNAVARHFDRIGRLWETLEDVSTPFGFCLDTCHTHAAGEKLDDAVERIVGITGRIDLVHLNDSKDEFGSGRDRHQNLGEGRIDPDVLVEVVRRAGADVVVETPDGDGDGQAADIAWLRDRLGPA